MIRSPVASHHEALLDCLRAVAAVLVMVGHVRGAFFVAWGDLEPASRTAINMAMFAATRLGREAVIVFFVLSGYLVGGCALEAAIAGRFRLGGYMNARLARLYSVLVPAMVVTVIVDLVRGVPTPDTGPVVLLVNLFFLQGIAGPTYGSNAPLWSLAYEWWYYVMFGLALDAFRRKGWWRPAALATIAVILAVRAPEIVLMFPMWLLGVAVSRITMRGASSRWWLGGAAVLLVAMAVFDSAYETLRDRGSVSLWRDYLVALAAAAFIVAARVCGRVDNPMVRLAAGAAPYSFTLYAVHAPLLQLAREAFFPVRSPIAGPMQWLQWLAVCAALLLAAKALYWVGERHTAAVRTKLDHLTRSRGDLPSTRTG